jgi:hypothetical protein
MEMRASLEFTTLRVKEMKGRMTNGQGPMTNQCPNVPMTKRDSVG